MVRCSARVRSARERARAFQRSLLIIWADAARHCGPFNLFIFHATPEIAHRNSTGYNGSLRKVGQTDGVVEGRTCGIKALGSADSTAGSSWASSPPGASPSPASTPTDAGDADAEPPFTLGATEHTPYQCQFCDKAFPRLSYLKKHEQRVVLCSMANVSCHSVGGWGSGSFLIT
ncbi:hypothetical protein EVAR_55882_1 [Eumeta japonica]|uniref:C2H2-type domain-containing protein n=1 Tax=Eumeta variegata TaxID=151549 RepID=A0A4C1YHV1_EUMVA|nr:hypothetical protein EVAR_55882_1 [Eumeta japonica]